MSLGAAVRVPSGGTARTGGSRSDPERVAAIQRGRLCEAMVQTVAARSYAKVTVSELSRIARVSNHALYDHFAGERLGAKRGCLLAAIDEMADLAVAHGSAAQRRRRGWRERLALVLGTFALDVARHPDAARVALFEALDPDAGALATLARAGERFEALLAGCLEDAPAAVQPPPYLVKGIFAGAIHVARAHLMAGRERELPRRAVEELAVWACACCMQAPLPAAIAAAGCSPGGMSCMPPLVPRRRGDGREERLRMLEACARIAAQRGRASLRVSAIEAAAQVRRGTFRRHFADVGECFIAAYELLCANAFAQALAAAHENGTRSAPARAVLARLAGQIAVRRGLAQIAFAELPGAGPTGVRAQTRLLETFARVLERRAPPGERVSPGALSAAVAAIWGLAGHLAVRGGARRRQIDGQLLARLMAPATGAARV